MKYALAIDIGASSGRHMVGWKEKGKIRLKEVYRFKNGVIEEDGHLVWDVNSLFEEVKKGIDIAWKEYPQISSLSIDSWGCDYVLMKGNEEVFPVYAYRDERTLKIIDAVHEKISFEELYERTGCQFQSFNTLYQLYEDQVQGRLEDVTDFLMIPEYLMYRLTGNKVKEFTNATTTGMINAKTLQFDEKIIDVLGFDKDLFPHLKQPGTVVGTYQNIHVVLCATHDTGSAVEGIPLKDGALYISSGTWSLLGVKTKSAITSQKSMKANYSNEGGVGYNRYQKNIMGMWIVNELKKELCSETDFDSLIQQAQESTYEQIVDINADRFLAPKSMKHAFDASVSHPLNTTGDYFRCAFISLAYSYKHAIEEIEDITEKKYTDLVIVGGGAKNKFLNAFTEQVTGLHVTALPIEASAIGNISIQLKENK